MRTTRRLLLVMLLVAIGQGCARGDWIDRTLVTESVTGLISIEGNVAGDAFRFKDDRGTLTGELTISGDEMRGPGSIGNSRPVMQSTAIRGPVEGTMAGETFRFKQTNGSAVGELTVSGDDMIGQISGILRPPPSTPCAA